VAFYLPGPNSPVFSGQQTINRAPHFAGGHIEAALKNLHDRYTVELWFWNGLVTDVRGETGWIMCTLAGNDVVDALGLSGTSTLPGKLILRGSASSKTPSRELLGSKDVPTNAWNHLVMVRDGSGIKVYLNGETTPEISSAIPSWSAPEKLFLAACPGSDANLEGKIDEVVIYDRVLSALEVSDHFRLSNLTDAR
jgi:hypothetical protein